VPQEMPRHPDKDFRKVLKTAQEKGWRGDQGRGYIHIRCPRRCGKHQRWVHFTPDRPYLRNLVKWLERQPCWKDGED